MTHTDRDEPETERKTQRDPDRQTQERDQPILSEERTPGHST